MTTASQTQNASIQQKAISITLSMPVQAVLYTSLCALTLWTVYFSTYPPAHDAMHSLRHSTAAVACH